MAFGYGRLRRLLFLKPLPLSGLFLSLGDDSDLDFLHRASELIDIIIGLVR